MLSVAVGGKSRTVRIKVKFKMKVRLKLTRGRQKDKRMPTQHYLYDGRTLFVVFSFGFCFRSTRGNGTGTTKKCRYAPHFAFTAALMSLVGLRAREAG